MEATQKKGLFKGKVAKCFSRVTKRTSHPQQSRSGSSKVGPCPTPPSIENGNGFLTGRNLGNYSSIPKVSTYSYASSKQPTSFHEQKNVANPIPSSTQKVSYASFMPTKYSFYDQNGYANDTWGHGDENVDFKATSYISNVRERFELDRSS
ncbi:Uncharacterized protein TCM_008687 [Theobroma cacao]|uniref:Uncharacterized protein n=1 Tax=Theobroma cacao TaxID=3641 RepID=A0A061E434_THECC|nr:Uncharacterized protein TCM_008687 [Theobroma cacao]